MYSVVALAKALSGILMPAMVVLMGFSSKLTPGRR
jgi:hypothetical protein